MRTIITNYIRSAKAGIYIQSYEEARVEAELKRIVETLNDIARKKGKEKDKEWELYIWSITMGLINVKEQSVISDTEDPIAMLEAITKLPEKSIVVARDFHALLADPNPVLVRKVKDTLISGKTSNKVFIIVGCRLCLPPELEKELSVLEFKLPDREQLKTIAENVGKSAEIELNGNTEAILDAASGLTTTEAEDAFALSIVESKDIKADIVAREKASTVKKNGILEIVETKVTLEDIGGLDFYKEHLTSIRSCFTKAARDYGLPSPRPVMCVGQPGTAKSMSAMATHSIFKVPLLRLEAGRLFGSLVGQSEQNWRSAFSTAKAVAPAILWIDEAEGLFSGLQSSGQTDGGTSARVIKAILQDMQFNGEGLFFVFTSNDIDGFPDPLIDRCDVWSFELPTLTEREAIWKIHIVKRGRKADKFNIAEIARATEGYSGRQIEQIWLKAMTVSFNDGGREPTDSDVMECIKRFVPTSVTMKDAIDKRRKRLENRAQPASRPENTAMVKAVRKLA